MQNEEKKMREILFRGKATRRDEPPLERRTKYKNGDWVFGLITEAENYRGDAIMRNTDGIEGIEVERNSVGQFTGLLDANGEKIFEGDILRERNGDDIGFVHYDDEDGMFYLEVENVLYNFSNVGSKWYEVIGNIHDNPELMEVE